MLRIDTLKKKNYSNYQVPMIPLKYWEIQLVAMFTKPKVY